MIKQPSWYRWSEEHLEPFWPLMILLSAIVIGITLYLIAARKRTFLAAWLTYLFAP